MITSVFGGNRFSNLLRNEREPGLTEGGCGRFESQARSHRTWPFRGWPSADGPVTRVDVKLHMEDALIRVGGPRDTRNVQKA